MAKKYFWRFAPFIFLLFWSGGYTFAKLGLEQSKIPPLAVQLIANLLSASQRAAALRIVAVDVQLNLELQSA